MKKQVKWIIWGIVIGVIVLLTALNSLKPVAVETIKLVSKTAENKFKEEGTVVDSNERAVLSQAAGEVKAVYVKQGQSVKQGDILAKLDDKLLLYQLDQLAAQKDSMIGQKKKTYREMQTQLDQLTNQLLSIEGQEQQSIKNPYEAQISQQKLLIEDLQRNVTERQRDFDKTKSLYASGAASKLELDAAESALSQAKSLLAQQEQTLNLIYQQYAPTEGNTQYFAGQKEALNAQINALKYELENYNSSGAKTGTEQYFRGLIDGLDAQINSLKYQIDSCVIKSPVDGIVKEINVKVGNMTTQQQPAASILCSNNLEVETYVLAEDVINIKEGMNVKIIQKRKDNDLTFEGTVVSIAPSAEEKISALGLNERRVKVTVAPKQTIESLRPGFSVDVEFTTLVQNNKLLVPKTAVFTQDGSDAVWKIQKGKAVIQKVKKGMKTDVEVVAEEGLTSGDIVIKNYDSEGLKPGVSVKY